MNKARQSVIKAKNPMKERRRFLVGALDSETIGLDGRQVLAQAFHETWADAGVYMNNVEMFDHVFSMDEKTLRKSIWYIHNIDYDLRYFFQTLKTYVTKFQFECRERCPGNFYEIQILSTTRKTKTGKPVLISRFRDSTAIYEGKLATFTEQFAPQFAKKDIGLGRGVTFDTKNPIHLEYARYDVIGLTHAIIGFNNLVYEHYSVHVAGTASGTAYSAWLRTLCDGDEFYRQPKAAEEFFRLAYYGGLVQMNSELGREYEAVHVFDINSSYPDAMRKGVPAGKARFSRGYKPGLPGFYLCRATVPHDAIMPILPHRNGRGQLSWPRGQFDTYISSLEIEYARERGFEVEVKHGFYFPDGLDFRFNAFVDIAEKLRKAYKKTPTEIVAKRMQNALYGRFGMKPDGRECVVDFEGMPEGFLPVLDFESGKSLGDVYFKNVTREAEYMMPHISAWITANARINIDRMCEAAGRSRVLYRDTDSLAIYGDPSGVLPFVGVEYGKLKNEGKKYRIKYHAPKCYTYFTEDGEPKAIYKGIPAKLLEKDEGDPKDLYKDRIATLHSGKTLEVLYHSSSSLQTFWKAGAMFTMRTRSSTAIEKIYSHLIEDGIFRPLWLRAS